MLGLQVLQYSVQSWRRQPSLHSCAVLHGHWRCTCPSLCNDSPLVQTAENCAGPAVAVFCGRCPFCAGSSWRPVMDKVVDVTVIVNDRVLHSGGASNSVHRLFSWTFQLCNTDRYDASSIFGYGGDDGFLSHFASFFALFRLSQSYAPVLGGLDGEELFVVEGSPCQLAQTLLILTLPGLSRFQNNTNTTTTQQHTQPDWLRKVYFSFPCQVRLRLSWYEVSPWSAFG